MLNIFNSCMYKNGIDIANLKKGDRVVVETKNSVYDMTVIEGCLVRIQGGRYFKEPKEELFSGCTLGTKIIRLGWICPSLRMEFGTPLHHILTSPVKNAIIYGENWFYNLHWND
jgi:hypothetical protein